MDFKVGEKVFVYAPEDEGNKYDATIIKINKKTYLIELLNKQDVLIQLNIKKEITNYETQRHITKNFI